MPIPDLDTINFTLLPEELFLIEDGVSRKVAVEFASYYGGSRISIPSLNRLSERHVFASRFGLDNARAICAALGSSDTHGVAIDCPTATTEFTYRQIFRCYCMGLSADQTAKETGVVRSTVFRALKNFRERNLLPDPLDLLSEQQKITLDRLLSASPLNDDELSGFIKNTAKAFGVPSDSIKIYISKTQGKT